MPEMHLRQSGFTYSASGPLIKNKDRIKTFKETGDSRYIYQSELDKACFQHDMAYGDFKDLNRRTAAYKVLRDIKHLILLKTQNMMDINVDLLQWSINFLIKNTSGSGIKNKNISNKELAEELHKQVIKKFNKRKVHSSFLDNIWSTDLADTQLISKFNKGFRFLLCVIDIYSKYAWVIPLKDKKRITITSAFQKILDQLNHKPNKIWVDKDSEFYNRSMKSWLEKSDIEVYSTHNERKSVVAEKFIRTLKNEIYKYMTSISKNVYIDKLDNIVNKYNNTYHSTIKMKFIDVKSNTYIGSSEKINNRNPKFKIADIVRILKYENIFAKGYTANWSEEDFVIKKVKIL